MQNNIKETIFMSEGLSNIVDLNMNNKDDSYVYINHEGKMFSVLSLVKTTKNTVLTFKTDIKLLTELIRDSIEFLEIFIDKEKIIKLNLKTNKFKLKIKSSDDSYIIKLKLKNNIVSEAKNGI